MGGNAADPTGGGNRYAGDEEGKPSTAVDPPQCHHAAPETGVPPQCIAFVKEVLHDTSGAAEHPTADSWQ